ncbi:hypothetical protein R1flu_024902 [Riccia fluitans]|uniref:Uncharacterized protein n=1 Tax=Riccia fluitans TaxID=41844 RepID=A0ABD1XWM6_9MARC
MRKRLVSQDVRIHRRVLQSLCYDLFTRDGGLRSNLQIRLQKKQSGLSVGHGDSVDPPKKRVQISFRCWRAFFVLRLLRHDCALFIDCLIRSSTRVESRGHQWGDGVVAARNRRSSIRNFDREP